MSPLEAQIREIYGRVTYTHKTHEKAADQALDRLSCIKTVEIVLAAITTTTSLSTLFSDKALLEVVAAVFSTILLGITLYNRDYNLGEIAQKHREAAASIWLEREKTLSLLTDLKSGQLDAETAASIRDKINIKLSQIYKSAPSTSAKAYKAAQTALKFNEELTFTVAEIDHLLPEELRSDRGDG